MYIWIEEYDASRVFGPIGKSGRCALGGNGCHQTPTFIVKTSAEDRLSTCDKHLLGNLHGQIARLRLLNRAS